MITHPISAFRAKITALLVCLSALPMAASASNLMIDFGPTVATGSSLTNSPYHSANGAFTDTYWNTVGNANVPSGLVYSNGDAATGVSLTLGSSVGSTTVNFSTPPATSSALGAAINSGVFAGTSVGKDGIFTSSAGNNLVGVKIGGLAAGTYEIYVVGTNTNNGAGYQGPSNFYATATTDLSNFSIDGLTPSASSQLTATNILSWEEGGTYAKMTVNLAAGEFLFLVVDGVKDRTSADDRAFLNSMQIVAIPEPSTVAFCIIGLLALPLFAKTAMRNKVEQK